MTSVQDAWAADTRSSEELLADALATLDEDARWDLVAKIHFRGGEQELRLAEVLTQSTNPRERCLGADVLGQLGWKDQTHLRESVDILIPMLDDPDPSVIWSAAYALGHRHDERAIGPLCKLADNPDPDVREGVAFGLAGHDDATAIAILIRLSSDCASDVRDWATFALGSMTEMDTPELRDALFARTDDEDGEIRGEALVGLAIRRDERALNLVREELKRDFAGRWVIDAAELVGGPSLLPLLSALRGNWCDDDEEAFGTFLDRALEACAARNET